MDRARRLVLVGVLGGLLALGCTCEMPGAPAPEPSREAASTDRHGLAPEHAARVVARIDGRTITVLDVADEIAARGDAAQVRAAMPDERVRVLEQLVDEELLADEARRRGLDRAPEVVAARREELTRLFAEEWAPRIPTPQPSESEIRARYERERELWHVPERVRAQVMVLRDRSTALDVIAQLSRATRLDDAWRELAARNAWRPPMLDASEEIGPFARPELARPEDAHVPPEVARVAFATDVGAIYPDPVEARGVFYVVRPVAREPATEIPYAAARERILERLRAETLAAELERLALAGRDVVIDDVALARLVDPWTHEN